MSTRSDSMAFEPTPAINIDKENNSPLFEKNNMTSPKVLANRRPSTREVRFSPIISPTRRAQSLATSVPLLPPVASASTLPTKTHHSKSITSTIDIEGYITQSRSLLETQRLNFERERESFEHERQLWNAERALLLSKIEQLELAAMRGVGGTRRVSNDSDISGAHSFQLDHTHTATLNNIKEHRGSFGTPVWEPEQAKPATRVFSEDDTSKESHSLASIDEDEALAPIERELSPTTLLERSVSMPVSIDQIDSTLDGITLKSTALTSSFVPRVIAPTNFTPQDSPSLDGTVRKASSHSLQIDLRGTLSALSPLDEKLKRHAGHTPMAFGTSGSTGPPSTQSSTTPTPKSENPIAPAPTARPPLRPSEKSDTYFSFVTQPAVKAEDATQEEKKAEPEPEPVDGDVALKHPLMLSTNNDNGQANAFLEKLDKKLEEAKSSIKSPEPDVDTELQRGKDRELKTDDREKEEEIEAPKLKLKASMNFGSAFGSGRCGNI